MCLCTIRRHSTFTAALNSICVYGCWTVLPEFMVLRIADKVKAEKAWSTALSNKAFDLGTPKSETSRSPQWTTLREKLLALVRMRSSWGELHDIVSPTSASVSGGVWHMSR